MGSTVMLKTVGAEGAGGYGSRVWLRVQTFQQQKSMARQRMVPPIMAPGEVKIQWLSMPSWAVVLASLVMVSSSWIKTSASNLPAILVRTFDCREYHFALGLLE